MLTAYINANVITIDPNQPRAEAFLVDGERFTKVGTTADILSEAGTDAEIVDLKGATIVPGFNDSHMHLLNYAYSRTKINFVGKDSIKEIQETAREYLREHPPVDGGWVLGSGWNHYSFPENRMLNRQDLDEVCADHPMVWTRCCEHTVVCNTLALEKIGITDDTPNPESGIIIRDEEGHATGILQETARYLAYGKLPDMSVEEIKAMLAETMDYMSAFGITSVQSEDFETFSSKNWRNVIQAYRELEAEGKMKIRVTEQCCLLTPERFNEFLAEGHYHGEGSDLFRIGPLKLFLDGSIGPRSAYLTQEYSDDPGNFGVQDFPQDKLNEMVNLAQANGFNVVCHAIGDAAMLQGLEAFADAKKNHPLEGVRNGLIHVQITTNEIIDRMKEDGIIAYAQPIFVNSDMHCVEGRIGAERMATSYAFKTIREKGIVEPYSSDCPVESCNPVDSLYVSVNRKDLNGYPENGSWHPEEKLSVEQMLQGFTIDGAYASYDEDRKGSIEAGKLADFVVFNLDPTAIDPEDLLSVKAQATYLGGKCVSSRS